ncbi:MAG TPA: ubiquinol-cytochrome c reductase iron-sulfur subunit [Sphingomonadales bacterium]|nr:ubiquinol-cytochrome c reductase iron-sulfur subunit [Sphingomonadales bacterium]
MAETAKRTALRGQLTRRDFIHVLTGGVGAAGAAAAVWPLIDQMNPSADVLALSTVEVDLSHIEPGQTIKVLWRKQPMFIRHRTAEEIAEARAVSLSALRDPQTDQQRTIKPEWLVMSAVCTHLGCIPLDQQGDYGGWFCPCHGSHYDTSGRIRKGPAPLNLPVPDYAFITDTKIIIGAKEA